MLPRNRYNHKLRADHFWRSLLSALNLRRGAGPGSHEITSASNLKLVAIVPAGSQILAGG